MKQSISDGHGCGPNRRGIDYEQTTDKDMHQIVSCFSFSKCVVVYPPRQQIIGHTKYTIRVFLRGIYIVESFPSRRSKMLV